MVPELCGPSFNSMFTWYLRHEKCGPKVNKNTEKIRVFPSLMMYCFKYLHFSTLQTFMATPYCYFVKALCRVNNFVLKITIKHVNYMFAL